MLSVRHVSVGFVVVLFSAAAFGGTKSFDAPVETAPARKVFEIGFETAQIFGLSNPNDYYILPQVLSLAVEPFGPVRAGPVRMRAQGIISFLGEPFANGPETGYLGGALRLRLIFPLGDSPLALYADGGAGLGGTDASGGRYGLGQDFTFNILVTGGLRVQATRDVSVWGGLMWQHLSNAGLSEPRSRNTAIDAIGPVLGVGYAF